MTGIVWTSSKTTGSWSPSPLIVDGTPSAVGPELAYRLCVAVQRFSWLLFSKCWLYGAFQTCFKNWVHTSWSVLLRCAVLCFWVWSFWNGVIVSVWRPCVWVCKQTCYYQYTMCGLLAILKASLMGSSFSRRPSGTPLHTLSKLYFVPFGFVIRDMSWNV